MAIAAAIFVLLGLALTGVIFWMAVVTRDRGGHRQLEAMVGIGLLALLRWGCFTVALAMAIAAGRMEWVCPGRAGQWIILIAGHVLLGIASATCLVGYSDASMGQKMRGNLVVPVALPVLLSVLLYLSFLPQLPVALLWGVILLMIPVGVTMPVVMWMGWQKAQSRGMREREAEVVVERTKYGRERLAGLEALGPEAHLYQLIQYTYANEPEDVGKRACELIEARPTFAEQLAETLRGDGCFEGLWYVAVRTEKPPVEVAAALFDGIVRVAGHIREKVSAYPVEYAEQFNGECERALMAVGKFKDTDVDFSPAIRALLEALRAGDPPSSPYGRQILEGWLRGAREGAAA